MSQEQIANLPLNGPNYQGLAALLRNDAFEARNFFSPSVPALKQNIFGGNIGGPVLFPGYNKGHEKTFFFLSMQGVVRNQASVNLGATPADMRAGKFDYSIIDPTTGNPFPKMGGQWVIPASRINHLCSGSRTCGEVAALRRARISIHFALQWFPVQ